MTLGKCVTRDQKGVFFFSFFFLDEQHMRACALFCVKRAAVMNTHTHTASRGTHRWFNKAWEKTAPQPAALAVVMRHIAAPSVQSEGKERGERRRGGWWMVDGGWWWWWGRESASPRVFPLSRLASVPQQAVVCRGCFCDQRAPTAGAPFEINWLCNKGAKINKN